jgi:hypothetical protein
MLLKIYPSCVLKVKFSYILLHNRYNSNERQEHIICLSFKAKRQINQFLKRTTKGNSFLNAARMVAKSKL